MDLVASPQIVGGAAWIGSDPRPWILIALVSIAQGENRRFFPSSISLLFPFQPRNIIFLNGRVIHRHHVVHDSGRGQANMRLDPRRRDSRPTIGVYGESDFDVTVYGALNIGKRAPGRQQLKMTDLRKFTVVEQGQQCPSD